MYFAFKSCVSGTMLGVLDATFEAKYGHLDKLGCAPLETSEPEKKEALQSDVEKEIRDELYKSRSSRKTDLSCK